MLAYVKEISIANKQLSISEYYLWSPHIILSLISVFGKFLSFITWFVFVVKCLFVTSFNITLSNICVCECTESDNVVLAESVKVQLLMLYTYVHMCKKTQAHD